MRLAIASALCASLLLAGCGSQVDPNTVLGLGGSNGGVVTAGGVTVGQVPGDASVGTGSTSGSTTNGGQGTPGTGAGTGSIGTGGGGAAGGVTPPPTTTKAGNCAGFENQTGITDDKIVLGNAADLSGPSPGALQPALDGAQAYVAFFNATSDVCGRKIELKSYDTKTDSAATQQAYLRACDEVFAMAGSANIFDAPGVPEAESCGLPDIRFSALSEERRSCSVCFAMDIKDPDITPNATIDWFKQKSPQAIKSAAILYIDLGDVATASENRRRSLDARGYDVKYVQGINATDFNYAPYVQKLKDEGIEFLQFVGDPKTFVRLANAMQQQAYKPEFFEGIAAQYSPAVIDEGGAAVEDAYVPIGHQPFDATNAEMDSYERWLQQVRPGAIPDSAGLYAWSATRLVIEKALGLGGKLTRDTLIAAVEAEHAWTANGMHPPRDVGRRIPAECEVLVQIQDGRFRQVTPGKYLCTGLTRL